MCVLLLLLFWESDLGLMEMYAPRGPAPGLPARDVYPGRALVSQGATRPGRWSPGRGAGVNSRAFCCRLHPNPFSSARGGGERRAELAAELARAEDHTGLEQVCRPGWANALEPCGRGSGVTVPTPHPHQVLEPDTCWPNARADTRGRSQAYDSRTGAPHGRPRPMSEASWPRAGCLSARFGRLLTSRGERYCSVWPPEGTGAVNPRTRRWILAKEGIPCS